MTRVPPLRRYYETLRLPTVLSAALRFLRLAVPCPAPLVRSRCARAQRAGAWRFQSRTPDRHTGLETTGSPRFLGSPHACVPCSFDPGGTGYTRPVQCTGAAFRFTQGVGPREADFGAQSHGPHTRCLRFAGRVSPPPRKTRFRLLASFAGREWLPAGLLHKRFQPTRRPPSPSFAWRTGWTGCSG